MTLMVALPCKSAPEHFLHQSIDRKKLHAHKFNLPLTLLNKVYF